jgi:hypothetical protein
MAIYKTDNSLYVFVGKDSTSENAQFQNDVTAAAATGSGSIFVVNEVGAAHSNAITASEFFKIGQKNSDGTVKYSPLLKFSNCTISGKVTAAKSEQSSVFGFNGSSGSIDAINSNRYTIRVNFTNDGDLYSHQSDLHFFEFVSDANATQLEIVNYFAQKMSKHEKFSGKILGKNRASVKVERLSDATSSAIGGSESLTVTNGSKLVVSSGSSHALVAGDYVRIGHASTKTFGVYKVVSVDGANITLDQPYQGASASAVAAGEFAAGSEAAGLKISGLEQEFILGLKTDTVIEFEITLDGFGDTTAVSTTAASIGNGTDRQVAELEWFGNGSLGAPYRHGVPNNGNLITAYADGVNGSGGYDIMTIDATIDDPKYPVSGSGTGRVQVVLALTADVHATDGAEANTTFGLTSIFNA